jgi:tRNA pseudouridine55 synthase
MSRRRNGDNIHGILLLDKRSGISSNKALQEVKRLYNANKAGHTGSLDPLATGLLPVCFGEGTKISGMLLDDNKRYRVKILLGIKTDTGDLEGMVLEENPVAEFSLETLNTVLVRFMGEIEQIPPMYSALKHNGKKLYELARAGQFIERKPRRIRIFELHLLAYGDKNLALDVFCSKGTYIRSLAEDIGQVLGCGATVQELRRVQSGQLHIDQAMTLDQLQQMDENQRMQQLIAVDEPLTALPAVYLDAEQAERIRHGQILKLDNKLSGNMRMYHATEFLGLGEMHLDGKLAPKKLFNLTV